MPARYCSQACQKEDWPKHKAWHDTQLGTVDTVTRAWLANPQGNELALNELKLSGAPVDILYGEAQQLSIDGKHSKALKKWKQAIALSPLQPELHIGLARAYSDSNILPRSVEAYLRAMDLCDHGAETTQFEYPLSILTLEDTQTLWVIAALGAVSFLMQGECAEVPTPVWWTDTGLKKLSEKCMGHCGALPDIDDSLRNNCALIRGLVLSTEHFYGVIKAHRTKEELREAAAVLARAATTFPLGNPAHDELKSYARRCFKQVQQAGPAAQY